MTAADEIGQRLSRRFGLQVDKVFIREPGRNGLGGAIIVQWVARLDDLVAAGLVNGYRRWRALVSEEAGTDEKNTWTDEGMTEWWLSLNGGAGEFGYSLVAHYLADADQPRMLTLAATRKAERLFRKAIGAKGRGGPRFRDIRTSVAS